MPSNPMSQIARDLAEIKASQQRVEDKVYDIHGLVSGHAQRIDAHDKYLIVLGGGLVSFFFSVALGFIK